jgi:hypothetical protein
MHLDFRSDGKETTNPLPGGGGEMKSHYKFESGALVGEITIGDGAVVMKDRITYSADNQWMTLDRETKGPDGSSKVKYVFERMPPDHPSMAGSWKLDAAKSDFGGGPVPNRMDAVITVDGHHMTMVQTTDQGSTTLNIRDDGEETTNDVAGMTMKSKLHWDGAILVGENVYTGPGGEITFHDQTTFSPDGKVMIMDRVGVSSSGERHMKIVMVRQ